MSTVVKNRVKQNIKQDIKPDLKGIEVFLPAYNCCLKLLVKKPTDYVLLHNKKKIAQFLLEMGYDVNTNQLVR